MRQLSFNKNQISKPSGIHPKQILDSLVKNGGKLLSFVSRNANNQRALLLGPKATGYQNAKSLSHVFLNRFDNKPRFEITDNTAKIIKPIPSTLTPLYKVLDHPVLYRNYPQLKNVKVKKVNFPNGAWGESFKNPSAIWISAKLPASQQKSVLIHEIQHEIQAIEGNQTGADPSKVGLDAYLSNTGEIEAKDSEKRTDMTIIERRLSPSSVLHTWPVK